MPKAFAYIQSSSRTSIRMMCRYARARLGNAHQCSESYPTVCQSLRITLSSSGSSLITMCRYARARLGNAHQCSESYPTVCQSLRITLSSSGSSLITMCAAMHVHGWAATALGVHKVTQQGAKPLALHCLPAGLDNDVPQLCKRMYRRAKKTKTGWSSEGYPTRC